MRTKRFVQITFARKAIKNIIKRSHIIKFLLSQLAWQISKADTNVKREENGFQWNIAPENVMKKLFPVHFVQWYQIQNFRVDGIKK